MNPVESLRSVLCDPDGNVVIAGSDGDREVIRQALEALAAPAEGAQGQAWRPMDTAPRDGTMLRLLVEFEEHATEDSPDPSPTIGANNCDHDGEDEWKFAGWCWSHDHFTQGTGKPVGWLPMLSGTAPPAASLDVDVDALVRKWRKEARELRDYGSKYRDDDANAKAYMSELREEELRALIDSAGGAKVDFCATEGHVTGGTSACLNCHTPQPAEVDGAVYQWHEFAGRWEDFTKEQFDEVQSSGEIVLGETIITPAMTRKLYTRPAATAVVPDADAVLAEYCRICIDEHHEDAPREYRVEAMKRAIAAAPAAPKGGVVDELCREARELQRKNYGSGAGLHLDMMDWARKYDALATGEQS